MVAADFWCDSMHELTLFAWSEPIQTLAGRIRCEHVMIVSDCRKAHMR